MDQIRQRLVELCQASLLERKSGIIDSIKIVKEGLLEETKSSMGDKFETSRAHLQAEDAKLKKQLSEINQLEIRINAVKRTIKSEKISLGSIVFTSKSNYYLSIPCGQINLDGKQFYAISPISPMGQLLMGKQKNEEFEFNNFTIRINEIY